MNQFERPPSLNVAVGLFFITGVFACFNLLIGRGLDVLSICSFFLAIAILRHKSWAFRILQVIAILYCISLALVLVSFIFPYEDAGRAHLSIYDLVWDIHPAVALILVASITAFHLYVAFSKKTRMYFAHI